MITFPALLTATGAGVTLHNLLQFAAARLGRVATDVESGNLQTLQADAGSVADAVRKHDPALAATVAADARRVAAAAEAEVQRVRHAAAEEIRRLAAVVEQTTAATAPAPPVVEPAPVAVVPAQAVDPGSASAV